MGGKFTGENRELNRGRRWRWRRERQRREVRELAVFLVPQNRQHVARIPKPPDDQSRPHSPYNNRTDLHPRSSKARRWSRSLEPGDSGMKRLYTSFQSFQFTRLAPFSQPFPPLCDSCNVYLVIWFVWQSESGYIRVDKQVWYEWGIKLSNVVLGRKISNVSIERYTMKFTVPLLLSLDYPEGMN